MRNQILEILPTYAENGNVVNVIVSSPTDEPISNEELADVLREYADYLDYKDDEIKN